MPDATKQDNTKTERCCSKCHETKPITAFTNKFYYCRDCRNDYMKEYRAKHKKPRKPTGVAALSKKKQKLIKELLKTNLSLSQIARMVDVKPVTMHLWKRTGQLDKLWDCHKIIFFATLFYGWYIKHIKETFYYKYNQSTDLFTHKILSWYIPINFDKKDGQTEISLEVTEESPTIGLPR